MPLFCLDCDAFHVVDFTDVDSMAWSDHTAGHTAADKIDVTDGDCHLIVLACQGQKAQFLQGWSRVISWE